MPPSITTIHSEHIINKRMGPIPTLHPYLAVYVKGHASMRRNKMANRYQARRDGAGSRNALRQGEMVQASGIQSGKERDGANIRDVTSERKNKQEGKQIA